MRLLIVDQCSARKDLNTPALSADKIDDIGRNELIGTADRPTRPASRLYAGDQQQRISRAVAQLREAGHEVDRIFVSAGFGLVDESDPLPNYDVTFSEMDTSSIDERAEILSIQSEMEAYIAEQGPYDILFFPLGTEYYRVLRLAEWLEKASDGFVILFNQEEIAAESDRFISIPARTPEAKKHGTIVVALKGQYLKYFAEHLANKATIDDITDIETYCTTPSTEQKRFDTFC